ncbi:hypothetical protein [Bacteroides ovatus]|jgi:hypothetical protein|uniref:hypothetical protein n=1 Tax=Bacteroides ovatus TaxID=28116 RepID=UPI00319D99A3
MKRETDTRDMSRECTDEETPILLFYNESLGRWTAHGSSAVQLLQLLPRSGEGYRDTGDGGISLDEHELEKYGLVGRIRLVSDNCLVLSPLRTAHADERSVPTPSA